MDDIGKILLKMNINYNDYFLIERDDGNLSRNSYKAWLDENPQLDSWDKKILDNLIEGNVLDIGCGTGKHVIYLEKLGYNVQGIDKSEGAIKIGKNLKRRVECLDFWSLLEDSKYDNIVLMDCTVGFIETPLNLNKFFKKIQKITSISSRLILTSVDWRYTKDAKHYKYVQYNIRNKRYPGITNLRLKDNLFIGEWFEWLWLDMDLLIEFARLYGFYPRWMDTNGSKYAIVFEKCSKDNALYSRDYFLNIENAEWLINDDNNYPYLNQSFISFNDFSDKNKRVVKVGPYRVSFRVKENFNILKHNDLIPIAIDLKNKLGFDLLIGGSQSPLSCKNPTNFSDIDIYIPIEKEDFSNIETINNELLSFFSKYNSFKISFSIIDKSWLELPFFCEACSPFKDEQFWLQSKETCEKIYAKRIKTSIIKMQSLKINDIIDSIEKYIGLHLKREEIINIIATPRWNGLQDKIYLD